VLEDGEGEHLVEGAVLEVDAIRKPLRDSMREELGKG
jgi:hypothetical protein